MSSQNQYTFQCPQCHNEGTLPPLTSINITSNPDLRPKIEDLSIFEWECSNCKKTSLVLRPCLYHNPEARFMIWFGVDDSPAPDVTELTGLQNYTLRYTDSPNTFREKINILERNLDDRAIELSKFILYLQLNRDGLDIVDLIFYDLTADNLCFVIVLPQGEEQHITMPLTTYQKFAQDVREFLFTPSKKFLKIDLTWAKDSLELLHTL